MGRIIIAILMLVSTFTVLADGITQEQQKAGKWVQENWDTVIEAQIDKNLDEEQQARCEKKLKYYSKKLEKKPDSKYYLFKLEKYLKRCTK
jgi:hypothetical protein